MLLGKFISTKVSKGLSIIAYCFSEMFRCLCVVFSMCLNLLHLSGKVCGKNFKVLVVTWGRDFHRRAFTTLCFIVILVFTNWICQRQIKVGSDLLDWTKAVNLFWHENVSDIQTDELSEQAALVSRGLIFLCQLFNPQKLKNKPFKTFWRRKGMGYSPFAARLDFQTTLL